MSFSELGLSEGVLRAVAEAGYVTPTPIQEQAIPIVLMGRDVLGCAQTGTGKTASFTLPMIDVLAHGRARARMPRSLILEPTRELAAQVAENFDKYGKYHKLNHALLIGGESMADQKKVLNKGVDVLIATPGRLLDLFERGQLLLTDVKVLVIDEADRMLDMGFIPDVERIVTLLSPMRQTLFFSATMAPEIRRLANAFLQNPKTISVSPPATAAATVEQALIEIPHGHGRGHDHGQMEKRAALRALLEREKPVNALIFCNRKRDIGVVARSLLRHGYDIGQLHGDMSQPARTETLDRFKKGEIRLLICSDVAARGLDIQDMSHVFNFDVPSHAEDYVHRIGRTGRAGRSGKAFTIALGEDSKYLAAIERMLGRSIPRLVLDGVAAAVDEAAHATSESSGRDHGRERGRGRGRDRDQDRNRDRGGRGRDRDRDRSSRESEAVPRAEAREAEPPVPQSREEERRPRRTERQPRQAERERPKDRPREGDHRRRHREDREDGPPVKGLGDHVPAFLLRAPAPSRGPAKEDDDEE
ncbi:MAG: DEAD/DEAH box helicase [Magnetospirillum sp. WYHS-4]